MHDTIISLVCGLKQSIMSALHASWVEFWLKKDLFPDGSFISIRTSFAQNS